MTVEVGQLFERVSNGATLRVEGFAEGRSKARMVNTETGKETRVKVSRLEEGKDYRPHESPQPSYGDVARAQIQQAEQHFEAAAEQGEVFAKGGIVPNPQRAQVRLGEQVREPNWSAPMRSGYSVAVTPRNYLPIIVVVVVLMIPLSLALSALLS